MAMVTVEAYPVTATVLFDTRLQVHEGKTTMDVYIDVVDAHSVRWVTLRDTYVATAMHSLPVLDDGALESEGLPFTFDLKRF
jgi:hypothetical protein